MNSSILRLAAFLLILTAACTAASASPTALYPAASAPVIETSAVAALSSTGGVPSPGSGAAASPPPIVSEPANLAAPASPTATLFRLPTVTPTATRTLLALLPSATPDCQDGLTFVEDLTIPDGTIVPPGKLIDKRWRVQNSGGCNWDARYRLQRISGPALGAPDEQALYPARSGVTATLRVVLVAPSDPGNYRSAWQAVSPQGVLFGDPIYVEINVAAAAP